MWLIGGFLATTAAAQERFGEFEMLEGQGVELCEACMKALETLPSDLSGCERFYNVTGFSEADWTELEPLKHLALLKKVMMFVRPVDPGMHVGRGLAPLEGTIYESDDTFKREIMHQLKHGAIALSSGMIDIDNDGRPEPVLKFRLGACINHHDPFHAEYQTLVVLKNDRATIDRRKTDLAMQNPYKKKEWPAGGVGDRLYDVFSHQGRVYFDKWDFAERDSSGSRSIESFTVYQAVGKTAMPICKYRYHRRYRQENPGGTR